MHLPADRPVKVRLRSKDVIHSFFVPQFRVKQDAVPGMAIDIWFVPNKAGDYEIVCNQICGLGHYRMRGFVKVESTEAFEKWLSEFGG
jgi:cytochrome c oxidase subunit 2